MAIEVSEVCYNMDSSEGDYRSAWFIYEIPTEAEENCIFVIRKKQVWLKATKNNSRWSKHFTAATSLALITRN
jgi:hypothetical protein